MNFLRFLRPEKVAAALASGADRRGLIAGAGVLGAAAVAAHLVSRGAAPMADVPVAAVVPEASDGYRLTPHVKRYYESTRA